MSNYHYYITVLNKVSFDSELFYKEYQKACSALTGIDLIRLKHWYQVFLSKNPDLELVP